MYTRALWICGCNHALADEVFQLRLFTWLRTREERQLGGTSCAETEAHTWPRSDSEVPGAGSPAGKAATGRNRGFDRAVVTMDLLKTICGVIGWKPALDKLPFEELQGHHPKGGRSEGDAGV